MSKFWNQLVKDEVWGSEPGRKGLTARMRHRWVNFEPSMDQLGRAKEKVMSLFCNDKHIFCGQGSGLVRVYLVASGEYVRDLVPREPNPDMRIRSYTLVAGGKEVVAAVTWDMFVTVWSTKGDMDWVASYQYQCEGCQKRPCNCSARGDGTIEDIRMTPHGKIVLLTRNRSPNSDSASSVLIMKKAEDGWTVDDSPMFDRCGFAMDENVSLGCHGDYFVLWERATDYRCSFGSAENNFEDWSGHPHNDQGLEFDGEETDGIRSLFLEPPFLILVNRNHDQQRHESAALMVYQMDTYKVLKAFEPSRGRCKSLITNEHVVVQLQVQWGDQDGDYILVYDKKMLLDMKKTAEEVMIQRIEINQGTLMSINTTSLVFAEDSWWQDCQEHGGLGLSMLNFWVGREKLGTQVQEGREKLSIKEEEYDPRQAEKKSKLS